MSEKQLSFDEAMSRLQEVVNQLDNSDLSLEDSISLFEEGLRLSSQCNKKLKEFEEKIESITDEYQVKEDLNHESTD